MLRIAEEPVAAAEVLRAEGLQRVVPHLPRLLPVGGHEATPEVIEEFAHQHARGKLGVVLDALPDVAYVQPLACGEERLEKQVAVFVARRAVPGAALPGHKIEPLRGVAARELSLVHADQGHHRERDAAHREHGAEGDAAGEKAEAALGAP